MADIFLSVPHKDPELSRKAYKAAVNAAREDPEAGSSRIPLPAPSPEALRKAEIRRQKERQPSENWDCLPIAQNDISRIPPVWSRDGRFYFIVADNAVHIHSSTGPTYPRLSTLSSSHRDGHRKAITSLVLSPTNPLQLITSSLDATIKIWDWVEGRLARTIDISQCDQIEHICVGQYAKRWWIFAAITIRKKKSNIGKIFRIVRTPLFTPPADKVNFTAVVGKLSGPTAALFISPRSTYLVALSMTKAYTYRLSDATEDARPLCAKFVSDQRLTCGAFAPEQSLAGSDNQEEWFATGDYKGVIRLWHGLGEAFRQIDVALSSSQGGQNPLDQEKRLPTTSLHWHAHAVSAIAFTPSGAQLLSVGEESVLVQWHLASGKREYIPRLGGRPIISLAVRPGGRGFEEEWWMALADGAVICVGSSSGAVSNIGQGVRLDPLRRVSDDSQYPLALHPSTNALVIPSSHPSTLQFIDPLASSVLFDLEVAPSNRISRRDNKELEPVAVEKVAFSENQDGTSRWMATVEGRKGDELEGGGMVKNLKIWRWNGERYIVNTQFPRPHGTSDITSVAFSSIPISVPGPSKTSATPYLLSTSVDGMAKLWHVRQAKNTENGKSSSKKTAAAELFWAVRSTFHYRSKPIHSSAFSPDCTLVALAHGSEITLWDVESNVLLRVLDYGAVRDIRRIGFIGSTGRYLVGTGSHKGITVWDLLSCQALWSKTDYICDSLLVHPTSPVFLTSMPSQSGSQGTILMVHTNPAISKPKRIIQLSQKIKDFCLLPTSSPDELHIAGITSTGEIYRFGDSIGTSSKHQKGVKKLSSAVRAATGGTSIWQEMFGKDAFLQDLEISSTVDHQTSTTGSALQQNMVGKSGKPIDVFSGPSHTLPPVSILFDAFMDELLGGPSKVVNVSSGEEVKGDKGILYVQNDVVQPLVNLGSNDQGRVVDDVEVEELEVFFKQVLGNLPTTDATGKTKSINGHRHVNGHNHPQQSTTPQTIPLINGYKSSKNETEVPIHTPKKINGDVIKTSAQEEENNEREIQGPPIEGSGRKRGKKRRAPNEVV